MKKLLIYILFVTGILGAHAQNPFTYVEWFVDDDPGFGNATTITWNEGTSLLDWEIPLSEYEPGIHRLFIRGQDSAGVWSHTQYRTFLVLPDFKGLGFESQMVYAEWFIDEDPGFGSGIPIDVSVGFDSISWDVPLTDIEPGVHRLYIRAVNSEGIWTQTRTRSFMVQPIFDDPITEIQYAFTDTTGKTFSNVYTLNEPQNNIEVEFLPVIGDLTPGTFYEFCVTAVTQSGAQSATRCDTLTYVPSARKADTMATDTTVMDTTVSDTTVIDTTVSDTTVMDTTLSDTTVMDTTVSDTTAIDTTTSDTLSVSNRNRLPESWVKVYPNPADSYLMIERSDQIDQYYLTITNMMGQQIRKQSVPPDRRQVRLDVKSLPPGIYMIILESRRGIIIRPFSVKR